MANKKEKYNEELINELKQYGIPKKYHNPACRFHINENIPIQLLATHFKQWNKYANNDNVNVDINNIDFNTFINTIHLCVEKYCINNILFNNDNFTIGEVKSNKDITYIPIENNWNIKTKKYFDKFSNDGHKFYLIYVPKLLKPFTLTLVDVKDNNVTFYNTNDTLQNTTSNDNETYEKYKSILPNEINNIIYNK